MKTREDYRDHLKNLYKDDEFANSQKIEIIAEVRQKLMENGINFMLCYDVDSPEWSSMWSFYEGEWQTDTNNPLYRKRYENFLEQICLNTFRYLHTRAGDYCLCNNDDLEKVIDSFGEYVKKNFGK